MKTGFLSPLVVKKLDEKIHFSGNGQWRLEKPLIYGSRLLNRIIFVPENFKTDFATVPRLPLVWLLAGGVGDAPAVIHDFLWRYGKRMGIHPYIADRVFLEALAFSKVPFWRAYAMYLAVRIARIFK